MIRRIAIAYRFELAKAARRKFTYAGPVFLVLLIGLMPLARPIERDGLSDYMFVAYVTPMALNLLGFLFLLTYCAALVSSEVSRGTVCLVLVRPLRRYEFILAKLLLGMTYAVMLTATVAATSWFLVVLLGDLRGVSYGGEVLYANSEMVTAYLLGAGLVLLPQFAAAAYALMISTLTRSTVAAVGAALGIWIITDAVKYPLHAAPFVFTTYLEAPWQVFIGRCEGMDPSWFPDAVYTILASSVALVVFSAAAIAAFARGNLHP